MNKIYNTDCLSGLKLLPNEIVDCCVTSPPYFGLRDYGHAGQIGLEPTPDEYIAALTEVFREVRRVLKPDGTLWLNLGDSYSAAAGASGYNDGRRNRNERRSSGHVSGAKPKDLIGIPWMAAFALRADGWYLRQDIIWHKPNPMPESVTDRCTKSHEYIFLMSKSERYWFDNNAIKEPSIHAGEVVKNKGGKNSKMGDFGQTRTGFLRDEGVMVASTRNKRTVWSVTTKPFKEAHFATFPPDLIEPCILAGCRPGGIVLDPFMGAGTTAMVAAQHGRQYVGFELSPEYCEIAERRLDGVQIQMA